MELLARRAPARVKAAGGVLLAFGGVTALGVSLDPAGLTSTEVLWNLVGSGVAICIGIGLFFSQRWAWVLALMTAVAAVGLGVYYGLVDGGDITSPGIDIAALVLLVIPGLLLVALLLSGASLRWFRRHLDVVPAEADAARL